MPASVVYNFLLKHTQWGDPGRNSISSLTVRLAGEGEREGAGKRHQILLDTLRK